MAVRARPRTLRYYGANPRLDAALLDLLGEWAGSEAVRERVLVANPARLYGF